MLQITSTELWVSAFTIFSIFFSFIFIFLLNFCSRSREWNQFASEFWDGREKKNRTFINSFNQHRKNNVQKEMKEPFLHKKNEIKKFIHLRVQLFFYRLFSGRYFCENVKLSVERPKWNIKDRSCSILHIVRLFWKRNLSLARQINRDYVQNKANLWSLLFICMC